MWQGSKKGALDDCKLAQVGQSVDYPVHSSAQPTTWPSNVDLALSSTSSGSPKQISLAPGWKQAGFLPVEAKSATAVWVVIARCVRQAVAVRFQELQ